MAQPPPTHVLFVRHAVTAETGPVLSGRRAGIDLSEKGREQARRAGERLAGVALAAVYTSPLERCLQTAEAVCAERGLAPVVDDGLAEADYGEWSGQKIDDLRDSDLWKVIQVAPSGARFPGGESMREMQWRIVEAVSAVVEAHRGAAVAVVSHADPIKAALAHWTGLHFDLFQRLHVGPASVSVLRFDAVGAALVKLNDTGSLDDLAPASPTTDALDTGAGATTDPAAVLADGTGNSTGEYRPLAGSG